MRACSLPRLLALCLAAAAFVAPTAAALDADSLAGDRPQLADRQGALVDEVVFTQQSDVGKVAGLIEAGDYHLYAQGITSNTVFRRLRDSEQTGYERAYGSSTELTLNPAGPELADGSLNPFAVRDIREAMNWLVDRRHVAQEIYGGMAVPRFLPVNTAFPDYARMAAEARALEVEYAHDPERARRVLREEMRALGAELQDGEWHYQGEPVELTLLIRTEDARKQVGDYVANLLADEGFRVSRQYRTAEEASRIWIATDPAAGEWHLYTGSWVSTMISRDVARNLSYYYTPRGRPDPLWQAYDPVEELDTIARRLEQRDYDSTQERQELLTRGMELALEDSARIWLVDQTNIIPRAADVALAADLAGGIAGSRLWPYTLRFRDQVGGQMVFAAPSLLTEPWNPVAGSNWLFDTMITRALGDAPVLPDPFTGLHWPQRISGATVTVQEGVPVQRTHDWLELERSERIPVPDEAWVDWDPEAREFVTAGDKHPDGLTARTRTVVRYEEGYLDRRWHDGSRMSLADIILPWILTFARADEASPLFDGSYLPRFELFQSHFRGWHIRDTEPLEIAIYSDQIFPDAETIVAQRAPSTQPWHTLALGIRAERNGELAFSSDKADRKRIEWLSLVSGPSLEVLERKLANARDDGEVPYVDVLSEYLGDGEVAARFDALAAWYDERRHFWVGDGPFYLEAVHPIERTVVLRRYEDFPDPADKWLRFSEPAIPELALDGPLMVPAGSGARFNLGVTFQGEPYPPEAIQSVTYMLFDGDGALVREGAAQRTDDGRWQVSLDAEQVDALGSGANSLEVVVTSSRVALPSFASHAFATVPPGTEPLETAP